MQKVNIHSGEFSFIGSYEDYFEWLVHGFKEDDDQEYDLLTNKTQNIYFIDLTIIYKVY